MVTKRPHPTHWANRVPKAVRLLASLRGRPRRVVVAGPSMLPAFRPGDRLVVVPVGRLAPGDVVALVDPVDAGRLLVKRVRLVAGDTVDVRGDNEAASTDSRDFGAVPATSLVGRVVYRYHPADRAGWLPD
jgi:nickel-type superoxide dismutase maturation protease